MTEAPSKALLEWRECSALASDDERRAASYRAGKFDDYCVQGEDCFIAITRAHEREEKLTAEVERLREAATALVNAVIDDDHLRHCGYDTDAIKAAIDLRAALAGEVE